MKKGREDHWEEEGYSLAKRLHDSVDIKKEKC